MAEDKRAAPGGSPPGATAKKPRGRPPKRIPPPVAKKPPPIPTAESAPQPSPTPPGPPAAAASDADTQQPLMAPFTPPKEHFKPKSMTDKLVDEAYQLAREGIPYYMIACAFGVSRETFYDWRIKNARLEAALMKGKAEYSIELMRKNNMIVAGQVNPDLYPETRRKAIEKSLSMSWPDDIKDQTLSVSSTKGPEEIAWETLKAKKGLVDPSELPIKPVPAKKQ